MGQYFGTSQNGIEDKKNGTEGVLFWSIGVSELFILKNQPIGIYKKRKKKELAKITQWNTNKNYLALDSKQHQS